MFFCEKVDVNLPFGEKDRNVERWFSELDDGRNFGLSYRESWDQNPPLTDMFLKCLKHEPPRQVFGDDMSDLDTPERKRYNNWHEWRDDINNIFYSILKEETKFIKAKFKKNSECWNWLTISPRPMLTTEQLDDFEMFVRGIMSEKYFSEYYFVIECGKNSECPNYHAHMLYKFKNANVGKNFKRDCVRKFDRMFKCEKGIDWYNKKGKGWFLKKFQGVNVDPEIIQDKKDYCINSEKSFLHENYADLGISGSYVEGSDGSLTAHI